MWKKSILGQDWHPASISLLALTKRLECLHRPSAHTGEKLSLKVKTSTANLFREAMTLAPAYMLFTIMKNTSQTALNSCQSDGFQDSACPSNRLWPQTRPSIPSLLDLGLALVDRWQ